MPRLMLSDESWSKLKSILKEFGVYNKPNLRLFLEASLYRIRAGIPWRDLPESFGLWNSVYKRFNAWSKQGIWLKLFDALSCEPDMEWVFVDGTFIKAHQHSSGAATEHDEAIGKTVGGHTTKLHLAVDAHGLPIKFELTGGEVHDSKSAPDVLLQVSEAQFVVADKAYDSESIRMQIRAQGATPVIPRKRNSKTGNDDIDWCLYRYRHLVENAFARLKHFRAVATRFDKLKHSFASVIALVCAYIWLPM